MNTNNNSDTTVTTTVAITVAITVTITVTKKIADFLKLKKGEEVTIYPEDEKKLVVLIS